MERLRDPRTLGRYATVAVILLVIGALFVQREVLSDEEDGPLGVIDSQRPKDGELAPDFALLTPEGERIALSDFRGKTVVLNFWATWCPPCRAEMPELQAAWVERQDSDDFVVLAVDFDESAGEVNDFFADFELTFPVVIDEGGSVAEHYGVRGLPATFFIDAGGVLRSKNLGPVFGELLPAGIALADAGGSS
jgi:peroxiredoxin